MGRKVPVGSILLEEAFRRYLDCRWKNSPVLDPLPTNLKKHKDQAILNEHTDRSELASSELDAAFANEVLEARAYDGKREITVIWQDTFSPERTFYGGAIVDRNSPYRGLYFYTDAKIFARWLRAHCPGRRASTKGAETRCRKWLMDQMKDGPPTNTKPHYLSLAKKQFQPLSDRSFNRAWAEALKQPGTDAWKRPGRRKRPIS
jgi:hypothetical protein